MALAAISEQQSVNMLRSAALLSPIAYLNQIPTLLGKAAAYSFIGDVTINICYLVLTSNRDKAGLWNSYHSFFLDRPCTGWASMNSFQEGEKLTRLFYHKYLDTVMVLMALPTYVHVGGLLLKA